MKRQYKAAFGIAGIVVATTLVGLGIFLYFGSKVGVYVVGAGVPIAVVSAIGLYVRETVTRRNTTEGEFVRDIARSVGTSFREELTRFNRLQREYPRWEASEPRTVAEQLADDFASAGIDVDVDAEAFTVRNPSRVQEVEQLEGRVSSFSDDYVASFDEFVREEIDRSRDVAQQVRQDYLGEDGDPLSVTDGDLPSTPSIADGERVLGRAREELGDLFDRAVTRHRETLEGYDGDPEPPSDHLTAVEDYADASEWTAALDELASARRLVERTVDDDFSSDREALHQLLATVDRVDVNPYASDDQLETFDQIREQLSEMESALSSDQLADATDRARHTAIDVVSDLESELGRNVETIRSADVPVGFYTVPPAAATDYVSELEAADSLSTFRQRWLSATGELLDALDVAETKASVADSYDIVSDRIDESIRSNGGATADDLPVRDPEPFLELYAQLNPDVEYVPTGPAVRAEGIGEHYTVEATAQLSASTGEEHDLTISISGPDFDDQMSETTYVAAQATFDEVPYGEYALTANTPSEEFDDVETSVRVSDDVSETLVLPEVSLRNRVCDGYEDEVSDQLPAVAPELQKQFEVDEYLTPQSDIPVAEEYIPCLLVMWAENAGYTPRMDDGTLLVYDHDQFESRLQTIATHNISDGMITFDEMRMKFLSVPASDDLIATTIRDLEVDVTVDENGVSA